MVLGGGKSVGAGSDGKGKVGVADDDEDGDVEEGDRVRDEDAAVGAIASRFPVDAELERETQRLRDTVGDSKAWVGEALRVECLGKVVEAPQSKKKKNGEEEKSESEGKEMENDKKKKNQLEVLKGLWFSLRKGECFGFLG
jgi:hypothetical protein